jgi:hypothetical protein
MGEGGREELYANQVFAWEGSLCLCHFFFNFLSSFLNWFSIFIPQIRNEEGPYHSISKHKMGHICQRLPKKKVDETPNNYL